MTPGTTLCCARSPDYDCAYQFVGLRGDGPSQGPSLLNRASIAAHVGGAAHSVGLLDNAIQHTILVNDEGVGTVASDSFSASLRQYAPFPALLKPVTSDGVK